MSYSAGAEGCLEVCYFDMAIGPGIVGQVQVLYHTIKAWGRTHVI